jgi:cytochrome c oxidase assembly protein subunit 11
MTLKAENRRLSLRLGVVALGMFGFGFALVPFYNQICQVLGINSLEQRSELPANTTDVSVPDHRTRFEHPPTCR